MKNNIKFLRKWKLFNSGYSSDLCLSLRMSSINFYVHLSDAEDDITVILKILNPIKSYWWDNPSVKTTVF